MLHGNFANFDLICYLPTDACKNFGPILESSPTALATSDTSAPVASQTADRELMLEMRCARNALAASLDSSDDHVFMVTILELGIQCS
jgi:hypothetical protein